MSAISFRDGQQLKYVNELDNSTVVTLPLSSPGFGNRESTANATPTTIPAVNTPVKAVLGAGPIVPQVKFSSTAPDQLLWTDAATRRIDFWYGATISPANFDKAVRFFLRKNSTLNISTFLLPAITNAEQRQFFYAARATIAQNDFMEIWIQNETDGADITITGSKLFGLEYDQSDA